MTALRHKVLFIGRDLPVSGSGGSSAYRLSFIHYLANHGFDIEYALLPHLSSAPALDEKTPAPLPTYEFMGSRTLEYEDIRAAPVWNGPPNRVEKEYVQKIVQEIRPDLIIIDRPWVAGVLEGWNKPPSVVTAVLTHDVQYKKIIDYKKLGLYPYKRNKSLEQPYWDKQIEKNYLSLVDMAIAIQKDDFQTFKRMLPDKDVVLMPMAAPDVFFSQAGQVPGRLLFVGGGAPHNSNGLEWFIKSVWPSVLNRHPYASLHVCGDVSQNIDLDKLPVTSGISLMGRVADLAIEYSKAQVCIIPLLIGGGLKIKLVESMAYGRACVSTTVGVQGIQEVATYGVAVTDNPVLFSLSIEHLFANISKRKRFEALNLQYVHENLSPDHVYGGFLSYFQQVKDRQLE